VVTLRGTRSCTFPAKTYTRKFSDWQEKKREPGQLVEYWFDDEPFHYVQWLKLSTTSILHCRFGGWAACLVCLSRLKKQCLTFRGSRFFWSCFDAVSRRKTIWYVPVAPIFETETDASDKSGQNTISFTSHSKFYPPVLHIYYFTVLEFRSRVLVNVPSDKKRAESISWYQLRYQ
jgi:hypothetical protein